MDLRHLRTFVTVAEQGTVSKAALHLRITQPALSRQIGDLESALEIRLFERIRRRLVLTAEGEQLLSDCRGVLGAVDSLGERASVLRRGDRGILRIAGTPQSIEGVLSTFIAPYAKRHPNVQIRLLEAVGAGLVTLLESGQVHMTVGIIQASQSENAFIDTFPLSSLEFIAASRKPLVATTAGDIDIGSLAQHALLLLDGDFYVRQTFDAACRLAGMRPNVYATSRAPHTLLALAEAGHGVAVVPSILRTNRYRLRIARITHRGEPLQGTYAVAWDKRRGLPPYASDVCESLAAHVRTNFSSRTKGGSAPIAIMTDARSSRPGRTPRTPKNR